MQRDTYGRNFYKNEATGDIYCDPPLAFNPQSQQSQFRGYPYYVAPILNYQQPSTSNSQLQQPQVVDAKHQHNHNVQMKQSRKRQREVEEGTTSMNVSAIGTKKRKLDHNPSVKKEKEPGEADQNKFSVEPTNDIKENDDKDSDESFMKKMSEKMRQLRRLTELETLTQSQAKELEEQRVRITEMKEIHAKYQAQIKEEREKYAKLVQDQSRIKMNQDILIANIEELEEKCGSLKKENEDLKHDLHRKNNENEMLKNASKVQETQLLNLKSIYASYDEGRDALRLKLTKELEEWEANQNKNSDTSSKDEDDGPGLNKSEKYQCRFCDKVFPTRQGLGGHMKNHNKKLIGKSGHRSSSSKIECHYEDCNRRFTQKCSLYEHIRDIHDGYPFKCEYQSCDKVFKYKKDLNNHINKCHEDDTESNQETSDAEDYSEYSDSEEDEQEHPVENEDKDQEMNDTKNEGGGKDHQFVERFCIHGKVMKATPHNTEIDSRSCDFCNDGIAIKANYYYFCNCTGERNDYCLDHTMEEQRKK